MCIHSVKSLKLLTFGLVLFALNIFIPTSPHVTYVQSGMHVYAHIGTIMPTPVCTHRRNHACMNMHT